MVNIGFLFNGIAIVAVTTVALLILVIVTLSAVCFLEGRGVHFPEWLHIWATDPSIVLWTLLFVVVLGVVSMVFSRY